MRYRNPRRIFDGAIDCEIDHPRYGWIPFTCDPADTGALFDVAALYAEMDADPATVPYTPPDQAALDVAAAEAVRSHRDTLLSRDVDPVVSNPLRWADLTSEQQAAWASYRRALLDITAQPGFPHDVTWPVAPQ